MKGDVAARLGRRRVLRSLSAGAVVSALGPCWTSARQGKPRLNALMVINSMGGFDEDVAVDASAAGPMIRPALLRDALASGMVASVQTVGYLFGKDDPYTSTLRDLEEWERMLAAPEGPIGIRSVADLDRARDQRRLGLILAFQSSDMLGEDAGRVALFAGLGVRMFQLTYNSASRAGGGALTPGDVGLTPFGRDVVQHLNASRVIVDLSHGGRQLCLDAARASSAPVGISHTGCRALADHPRNASDQLLRLVGAAGGYVGIYFEQYLTIGRTPRTEDVLAHIEHAIQICGEDHVGLGTDGGTTAIDPATFMEQNARDNAKRRAAGIAAPGEDPTVPPFVPELTGPDQFQILADGLTRRGHSQSRIEKIMGTNFHRFLRDVWGT